MSRIVLRALVRTAFALFAVASLNAGCSRQAEGERCDLEWAGQTQDCNSGLICTACGDSATPTADRCCPADGTYSDSRCQPASVRNGNTCSTHKITTAPGSAGTGTTAGTGGSAATGGTAGTGGSDAGTAGSAVSGGTAGETTDTAGSGG